MRKSVQERPKSAPRATEERFWRLYVVVEGCRGLQMVVVQRRWEADGDGGGEVNLSVNDHQAVFIQYLEALRRGAGGFRTLTRNRRTLKGFHAFGLLRMFSGISQGSCMDFAGNSHGFCREVTSNSPPGGPKSILASPKSTSDRLEDS